MPAHTYGISYVIRLENVFAAEMTSLKNKEQTPQVNKNSFTSSMSTYHLLSVPHSYLLCTLRSLN